MPEVKFPHERKVLGWWLSLYEASTDTMAYCILAKSGKVVVRKSVWGITNNKMVLPATMDILALLDAGIKLKVGNTILEKNLNDEFKEKQPDLTDYIFDEDEVIDLVELELTWPDADEYSAKAYDQYISTTKVLLLLPHGGESTHATITRGRQRDEDGNPIWRRNANPLLDSRVCEVKFPDGSIEAITANLIAENIFLQVDEEGWSFPVLCDVVDHCTNGHAISKDDGFDIDTKGVHIPKCTTRGWELQVEWKDRSTN
jgi:hypothetical protein